MNTAKEMVIKMFKKGRNKHQLVEVDMLDIPKKVRKIYGVAKDDNQKQLFKQLGFKQERITNIYSRFLK